MRKANTWHRIVFHRNYLENHQLDIACKQFPNGFWHRTEITMIPHTTTPPRAANVISLLSRLHHRSHRDYRSFCACEGVINITERLLATLNQRNIFFRGRVCPCKNCPCKSDAVNTKRERERKKSIRVRLKYIPRC